MSFIIEPAKQVPVKGDYDVVVCGGGIAGISAALAAKRAGAKTLLIEKQFLLGGLATLGLITIYLPLCDGMGRQVSFGIAEELLHLSMKHGYEDKYPKPWLENGTKEEKANTRFEIRYNANICAILCEKLLLDEGVEVLYGTSVSDTIVENGVIKSLILENKTGRTAINVKSVVDTTGDADICVFAKEDTVLFEQKNVLASWYYYQNKEKFDLKMFGYSDIPEKYKTGEQKQRVIDRYQGVDGWELSQMKQDSHSRILENFLADGPINEDHSLALVATIPQVRMTRRIAGNYTLDDEEMHQEFEDSIGMVSDWRKKGPVYEIPFRTLYGKKVKNLITAGRCISVTDAMWDITRVIPDCAVTGEAAGLAAAMTSDFASLDIGVLQERLRKNGVVIHEKELVE